MYGEVLDLLAIRALLHLSPKSARAWVKKFVPDSAVSRGPRGGLVVQRWGVNHGLAKCVWQPKGFQGVPGRRPPNLDCRYTEGPLRGKLRPTRSSPLAFGEGRFLDNRRKKYLVGKPDEK